MKTLLLPLALLAARPLAAQTQPPVPPAAATPAGAPGAAPAEAPAAGATPPPAWPDRTRALPALLRAVPVGLAMRHDPNPVYPQPDPAQPGTFAWKHSTTVRAEVADLQVVECGSFIWYDATGWRPNLHETPAEFARLFECPGGRLRKGQAYTFKRNYRYATADRLYGGDALWYVLAKDAQGHLYKGWALVETEAGPRPAAR